MLETAFNICELRVQDHSACRPSVQVHFNRILPSGRIGPSSGIEKIRKSELPVLILVCSLQWKDVIGTRLYAHLSQRRLGVHAERLKNSEKSEKINYPENHVK